MRSRKKPWTQNELNTNSYLIENPLDRQGAWKQVFGNNNPIHLEIGCGKGSFIVETAARNPGINYIAVEKEPIVIASAIRLARESSQPKNLMFFVVNASELEYIFTEGEISRLYLNFSDPWDSKKKWAKRRLTHRLFLNVYEKILSPVEIFVKTDNKEFFEFSLSELNACGFNISAVTEDLHNSEYNEGNIMTEYEARFKEIGKPICRLEARK